MSEETNVATATEAALMEAGEGTFSIPKTSRLGGVRWNGVIGDAQRFVDELEKLRDDDRGAFAALRRNAGQTLDEARGASWMHGRLYSDTRRKHDEKYFLVATLFDLNRRRRIGGDMGATMHLLAQNAGEEAIKRRFGILLDADFDRIYDAQDGSKSGGGELAFRLRQMVKLAGAKEVGINWAVLLADLCCWDAPGKPVQKKWARNFYAPQAAPQSTLTADHKENTDVD
jgi:CRISPR system Cascade subunit CasB